MRKHIGVATHTPTQAATHPQAAHTGTGSHTHPHRHTGSHTQAQAHTGGSQTTSRATPLEENGENQTHRRTSAQDRSKPVLKKVYILHNNILYICYVPRETSYM